MSNGPDPVNRIITGLLRRTEAREIVWERADRYRYDYKSPSGIINIGTDDSDGQPPYNIRIRNTNGESVAFRRGILADTDMEQLYVLVRRQTLRVDETFDSFLKELGSGK